MLTEQRFMQAANLLPERMRRDALKFVSSFDSAEEIRLRAGRCPSVLISGRERKFSEECVYENSMRYVLERASQSSLHTAADAIRKGYVTAPGGIRVGIAGTAATEDGCIVGIRHISGMCIRVSRQIRGIANPVIKQLGGIEKIPSTLIVSPPGGGKTTLLRDIVRLVSNSGVRVSLCDERGEVAAMNQGVPQFDVGICTDVMDGCPREQAMEMLLRSMNPQMIAADEISTEADVQAMLTAAGCGVKIVATAHAESAAELIKRIVLKKITEEALFDAVVTVINRHGARDYEVTRLGGGVC